MEGGARNIIANAVWDESHDIRDCMKIGSLAKSTRDVEFILDKFFEPNARQGEFQVLRGN
jgi:hypothetical protein